MGKIKERESELAPSRIKYAIRELERKGYEVERINKTTLRFQHNGNNVLLFPYTGWFTGKSVQDGRGIKNLLKQLK